MSPLVLQRLQGGAIATGPFIEKAGDATDRGHADGGAVVDLAIGNALLQQRHDAPAIGQRFQFGRRSQITQEGLDRGRVGQCRNGLAQRRNGRHWHGFGIDRATLHRVITH